MPKINAATVKDHHNHIYNSIIDAAQSLLEEHKELTASAVSNKAGIARNSIYRYVKSVDELYGLVAMRHIPAWSKALSDTINKQTTPEDKILMWIRTNLEQSNTFHHDWIMQLALTHQLPPQCQEAIHQLHEEVARPLIENWKEISPTHGSLYASMTRSITICAMKAGRNSAHSQEEKIDTHDILETTIRTVTAIIKDARQEK